MLEKYELGQVSGLFDSNFPFRRRKTYLTCITAFLLMFLFFSKEALATTYYVSPTGSDISSGSVSAPFKTIQKAANIVNPGDIVIVKDGIYTDTDGDDRVVSLSRGGTSSNWITFKAENKWGAKLNGNNNATFIGVYFGTSASYIEFNSMKAYTNGYIGHASCPLARNG